jgi:hypothetical protein
VPAAELLLVLVITVMRVISVLVALMLHVLLSSVCVGGVVLGWRPGPGSSGLAQAGTRPGDEGRHTSGGAQPGPGTRGKLRPDQ